MATSRSTHQQRSSVGGVTEINDKLYTPTPLFASAYAHSTVLSFAMLLLSTVHTPVAESVTTQLMTGHAVVLK